MGTDSRMFGEAFLLLIPAAGKKSMPQRSRMEFYIYIYEFC